ncbi:MAG: family 78 glycoside hydrolase catalytic domain [Solobacterium sp.]|nr:family 78 glycoside hydrolase catalytic domain [Solobacterium sp.]
MKAVKLRTEHMINPVGIDIPDPLLSWNCSGGIRQKAWRVIACCGNDAVWDSGKVESSVMHCRFGAKLQSRQRILWRVCLFDENDEAGEWSEEALFETAFLEKSCWQAKWINPELTHNHEQRQPASCLKKTFSLDSWKSARLYITAHGVYAAYLNNKRVSDFILAPGTSEYAGRIHYQTYDISDALKCGENELTVIVGDGWYRGSNGIDGNTNLFGTDIALLCQLETDGCVRVISDESWSAAQDGAVRFNDLQDGERVEAFRGQGINYHPVKTEHFGYDNLFCSNAPSVHEQECFRPVILKTPNGETVLDFTQNMAGYVEFTVEAQRGQTIRMIHGETLDENGNFTIANFQPAGRKRNAIRQEIQYTCKDGMNCYKPLFCFFGFRYVKLETEIPVERFSFTAHAVYSDMEQTGWFSCSNEDVNSLVRNTIWSQKSNFLDIPTDCPTRERQGWTGDAGIFVKTGLYLMDCGPVLRKWLADVRDTQRDDGVIRGVAPRTDDGSGLSGKLDGSPGWAEACIIVPYALYRQTGDRRILKENYGMIKRWMDFQQKRAQKSRLKRMLSPYKKYIIDTGFAWGEWQEPDVPVLRSLLKNILFGAPEIATAYYAYSCALAAKIAGILGYDSDAQRYKELAEHVKNAYRGIAVKNGRIISGRQADCVRPLAMNLLTGEEKRNTAMKLNRLVIENGWHLNTGFLSTGELCRVLSENGFTDTAYRLLLQEQCPGWLYEVKKGATTIWESWNGIAPDGSIRDSLNHYSYGAVTGWLFDSVCGIRVNGTDITIAPLPSVLLEYAKAAYDSPQGMIRSGWKHENGSVVYEIEIPANCEADVILGREKMHLGSGTYHFTRSAAYEKDTF